MKSIVIVMLCAQVLIILVTAYAVAVRKPTAAKPGPVWLTFALSLFIVGGTSMRLGGDQPRGAAGVEVLMFVGAVLVGMAVMCLLLVARERFVRDHVA